MGGTLCWDCKNAYGKCPWSAGFEPVENWVAEPTKVKCDEGRVIESYLVRSCPMFEYENLAFNRIGIVKLGKILGISPKSVSRLSTKDLEEILLEKDYDLEIKKGNMYGNGCRIFYIRKHKDTSRITLPPELMKLFKLRAMVTEF